jgi:hypothetical protein
MTKLTYSLPEHGELVNSKARTISFREKGFRPLSIPLMPSRAEPSFISTPHKKCDELPTSSVQERETSISRETISRWLSASLSDFADVLAGGEPPY